MSQYSIGLVDLTSGLNIIVGTDTEWTSLSLPLYFKRDLNGDAIYEVSSIVSDTELTLTTNYEGYSGSNLSYQLVQDFSVNYDFPLPYNGDTDAGDWLRKAIVMIDNKINNIEDNTKLSTTLVDRVWSFQTVQKEEIYSTVIGPYTVEDDLGNERQAILFGSYNWVWYALDTTTGEEIFQYVDDGPIYGRLQATDVDGDGEIEIFVPNQSGTVKRFNRDGTLDPGWLLENVYDREGTGTITGLGTDYIQDASQSWADNAFLRVDVPTTQEEADLNAEIEFTSGAATGGVLRISTIQDGTTLYTYTNVSDNGTGYSPNIGDTFIINPAYDSDVIFMHAGQLINEEGTWYLYTTSQDSHLYKTNANNGTIIWKRAGLEAIESWPWIGDLFNDGGRYVLWVCYDQYLRCLNATNGNLVWETDLGGLIDGTPQVAPSGLAGSYEIFQTCRSGKILRIDPVTGTILDESGRPQYWQDIASMATPLKKSDNEWVVCVGGRRGDFGMYDREMFPKWKFNVTPDNINSTARFHDVSGNGKLDIIVADMVGTIHIFNEEGTKISQVYAKGAVESIPLIADIDNDGYTEMVVTTIDGWCHCFRFVNGTDNGYWGECTDAILMPIPPDSST